MYDDLQQFQDAEQKIVMCVELYLLSLPSKNVHVVGMLVNHSNFVPADSQESSAIVFQILE
jgi:hypothetical protein